MTGGIQKNMIGILPVILLIVTVGLEHSIGQDKRTYASPEPFGKYLQSVIGISGRGANSHAVAVFLLRFEDFGCLACFESLLELCESIESHMTTRNPMPAFLMFPAADDESEQWRLLDAWRKANNIRFKMTLVPSWRYDAYSIRYSTVALLDSGGTVNFARQLPLSSADRNRILAQLFPRRRK